MTGALFKDRDAFRRAVWDTYYKSYFQELLAVRLSGRWHSIDAATSILVSVTAAGFAVASWSVWHTQQGKLAWTILAALVALLSIVHRTMAVPEKIKKWEDLRHSFAELRVQLDTILMNDRIQDDAEPLVANFTDLRKRYEKVTGDAPPDIAYTNRVRSEVQHALDAELEGRGESQ